MNYKRTIQEGLQSLRANRVRSSLSVIGIVFGVAAVVAMLAVVEGARNDVLERLSRLGSNVLFVLNDADARETHRELQFGDAHRLEHISSLITMVAPAAVAEGGGTLRAGSTNEPNVLGVTPVYVSVRQLTLQAGRSISDLDLATRARVCVVGREVKGSSGQRIGLGDALTLGGHVYQVVGTIASQASVKDRSLGSLLRNHNNYALVPMTAMPRGGSVIDEQIPTAEISVRIRNSHAMLPVSRTVARVLSEGQTVPPSIEVVVPRQLLREEQHAQRVFATVVGCVSLIGVLVGGIGVMNIMLANVAERYSEIGIRRAVGATKKQITMLFLVESTLLTLLGGFGGLLLGFLASFFIATFGGWVVNISWWSVVLAMGMAGTVGIAAGWYPAIRAANLDPIEAIRRA